MKKSFLLTGIALLCMAACDNIHIEDVNSVEAPDGMYLFTLKANADAESITKTAYASDKDFSWSAGDEISVLFNDGVNNKYFTLKTTTGGSASATFTGFVTNGWNEGATDGAKVALYPANDNHEYRPAEENYKVWFNIPSEIDFTAPGAHSSANIPMQALNTGDGYTFTNLSCCYKFSFKVAPEVKKVKFTAENIGNSYYLSGLAPIRHDSGEYLQFYNGNGSKVVSLIENVGNDNIVTFYLPSRIWNDLKINFSLQNMTTGAVGYSLGEYSGKTGLGSVSTKMVVLPTADISAKGAGTAFTSKFGIDWSAVAVQGSLSDSIGSMKAAADANYLYVYAELDASMILAGPSGGYGTRFTVYLGNESSGATSWMWGTVPNVFDSYKEGWLYTGGNAKVSCWAAPFHDANAAEINGTYYCEMRFDRTAATYLASGNAHVGMCVYFEKYHDGAHSQGADNYKYGPTGGSMLEVALP